MFGRARSAQVLQTGPIGYADQINLYAYVGGDPLNATDPDGRELRYTFNNGSNVWEGIKTMAYLAMSPTARAEIAQIVQSSETYTINFDGAADGHHYDQDTRTITTNPNIGLIVESSGKIQSAALGAGHEITHAAEHDRIGTDAFVEALERPVVGMQTGPGGMTVTFGDSPEENRATAVETQMANELGEPARQNYGDEAGSVTTCGPTSRRVC